MKVLRNIQIVKNGEVHLQLPQQFWGQEVEIIALPAPRPAIQSSVQKRNLRGSLKAYAKPELIVQEQEAWHTAAGEKHEPRL